MKKVIGKIGVAILTALIAGFLFLEYKFKNEITSAIATDLPQNMQLNYAEINTNILSGTIELDSLSFKILNSENKIQTYLFSKNLKINGLSLWKFLFNKKISIDQITITNPELDYFIPEKEKTEKKDATKVNAFDKEIIINQISVNNGFFKVNQNKKDSILLKMDSINFTLKKWTTDANQLKEKIPFRYQNFELNAKDFLANISNYEDLKIENLSLKNDSLSLQNLFIEPKFTKEVLSTKIIVERDHIQLHIPAIELQDFDFRLHNKKFFVHAEKGQITELNLKIYRDKRVADNKTFKKVYSEMLRDLSFELAFSTLKINQGYINYSERLEDTEKAGEIFFNDVNASIKNLSNTNENNKKTAISVSSDFMGKAPMRLDISFDINNEQDVFLASGQFENFDAQIANEFFKSNLNAKAEGSIAQIYFTFNGNNTNSKGDLKMKYKEFKFEILTKENRVNKFLTAVGNLFVSEGSNADIDGFRHGKIAVERNKNKSFFNYLWINVQDGLISTLTGNGEKE